MGASPKLPRCRQRESLQAALPTLNLLCRYGWRGDRRLPVGEGTRLRLLGGRGAREGGQREGNGYKRLPSQHSRTIANFSGYRRITTL